MNPIIIAPIATFLISVIILLLLYNMNKKQTLLLNKAPQEKQNVHNQQFMALKIQAYERIILYIERIELESLVMRIFLPEMTVQQLQATLLRTIREEFEHNTTQQLYVTDRAWEYTKGARTLVLTIIAQTCKELLPSDNGMQLAQTLFTCVQDREIYDFNKFPVLIKREMEHDLSN